jgi:hypothetical protein
MRARALIDIVFELLGDLSGREIGKDCLVGVVLAGRGRFYILSGIVANKFLQLPKLLKHKELRLKVGMKENAHFQLLATGNAHGRFKFLVSSWPASLADSIGVNSSATATNRSSHQCALLATRDSAN